MICKVSRFGRRHSISPFGRPGMHPDRQLDLLLDQIAQHAVERAQPGEGAEDQADDMLRLLVRVEDDLAGRAADVPDRQRDRQLAALGLGQLARQHPLPDQVQLCSLIVPFSPSSSRSLPTPGS